VVPLVLKWRAAAFDNPDWLFELKYDGLRALLEIDDVSRDAYPVIGTDSDSLTRSRRLWLSACASRARSRQQ
jgi:hypothetical protein